MVAITMDRRPNSGLPEKVATTSENTPNAGGSDIHLGMAQHQIRLMYIMALPPRSLVKKWNPQYRSSSSMAKVAVKIGKEATISRFEATAVQQKIGISR